MFITFLELYKYKRIMLNGRERLVYEPAQIRQLLVGRNGSGKSSVLQCLMPRAQKPSDFEKGGHYLLRLTHNQKEYEISSTFVKGAHHSFQVEGVEENEGGTGRVQDELVRQHFGLTSDVISLLLGETLFTQMPPMKRREWFMRLSNTNLDYVLKIFKEARGKIGQTKGVVNHLKEKLAGEIQKLRDDNNLASLEEEISHLQKTVTMLLREVDRDWSTDMSLDEFDFTLNQLNNTLKKLLRIDLSPPDGYQFDSLESIRKALSAVKEKQATHRGHQAGINNEYRQLEKIIRATEESGAMSIDSLSSEMDRLNNELSSVQASTESYRQAIVRDYPTFDYMSPEGTIDDLETMVSRLLTVLPTLPNNEEPIRYREEVGKLEEVREGKLRELTVVKNKHNRITAQIEHHAKCESVTCPKCDHGWKPGIDESIDDKLARADKVLTEEIQAIEKDIAKCDELIRYNRTQASYLQDFLEVMGRYPSHVALWNLFKSEGLYHKNPSSHEGLVRKYQLLVLEGWKTNPLKKRISEIVSILEEVKKHRLEDQSVEGRLKTLNDQYADLETLFEREENTHERLAAYERRILEFLDGQTTINTLKKDAYRCVVDLCGSKRNSLLDELIKEHNLKLSFAHKALHEDQTIRRMVEDLETSLVKAEGDLKAYQLLVRSLSPTEGIIADQISGFIGHFCDEINEILSEIWTYELSVKPCHVEDGDLDYRFPLDVMNGVITTSDVKDGSAGQQEIVNLAFKMVAQLSLGLENIPLYLDEPGQNLDPTHVSRLMNYIKQVADGQVFPQLFMISHDLSGYGAMTHAQTLVLDKENINTLDDFNSHADLT